MDKLVELMLFLQMGLIAISAIFFMKNPKRFILGMIIITAGWQGGLWISFMKMDMRFSQVLTLILFAYIILNPQRIVIQDRYVRSILIPSIGMMSCAFLASFQAQDPGLAFGGAFSLLIDYLVIVCIIGSIEKPQDIVYILKFVLAAVCFQILLALLQYRIAHFKIGIIDEVSSYYLWWRMHGTYGHPNQLGMFYVITLPFIFRFLVIVTRNRQWKLAIIIFIIFLFGLFSLYTTQNRGSETAFAIAIILTIWIDLFRKRARVRKTLIQISTVVVILMSLAMVRYGQRIYDQFFNQPRDVYEQYEGRALLNEEAIPRITENLPFGMGMGNYESGFWREAMVHNLFLLIPAEIGIGSLFFVWIIFMLFYEAIKLMRVKNVFVTNLGSAFLAMLLGFIVSSWVGPDWFLSNQVRLNFWIICGIVLAVNRLWSRMIREYQFNKKKKLLEQEMNSQEHIGNGVAIKNRG